MTKLILLTHDELEIIIRVIAVPLGAFGLSELIQRTQLSEEECRRISDFIGSHRSEDEVIEISIDENDIILMSKIFDISAEIVDPQEMHTMTGYTWDEARTVSKKLHALAKSNYPNQIQVGQELKVPDTVE
ncbi:MAG: hypothetical protein WC777_00670 [Candidatus Gracilibacteria bacterium]|jgi:hypothetical protein